MNAPITGQGGVQPAPLTGKRAETKARNRSVILDAARRVFAERGFSAATVRDVIRATPLAAGTFYKYFRCKEDLLEALGEAASGSLGPALRDACRTADSPHAFYAAAFKGFFSCAAAHPESFAAMRSDVRHAAELAACFAELKQDIDTAVARGILPPLDSEWTARAMQGVAFQLAAAMLKRDPPDPVAATVFASALFAGGASSQRS